MIVRGYRFLTFAKNIKKNIGKNFDGKCNPGMLAACQRLLDHAKKSATDALKITLERVIQETAEKSGNLIS